MADRKARSLTFPTPEGIGLGDLKAGIQKEIQRYNCSFSTSRRKCLSFRAGIQS